MPLAETVLAAHLAIILFNLFGLVAVPLGAVCGWRFVHVPWWRVLHAALLAAVAGQAAAGRACILTVWQDDLAGHVAAPAPLIAGWIDRMIYWPLPLWVFALLYVAIFVYAVALLWLVPPRRRRGPDRRRAGPLPSADFACNLKGFFSIRERAPRHSRFTFRARAARSSASRVARRVFDRGEPPSL